MVKVIGGFEEVIEKGQSSVKRAARQTVSDFAKTAKGQIAGSQNSTPQNDQGTNEQANAGQNQNQQGQMTDQERVEFLRNLYGKPATTEATEESTETQKQSLVQQVTGRAPKDPNQGKTPEEIAKIETLRRQLHGDYYQSLINPQKPPEENVTEKLEREDEEKKMSELEVQKKKPPPLPATVKRGTGEILPGVSG